MHPPVTVNGVTYEGNYKIVYREGFDAGADDEIVRVVGGYAKTMLDVQYVDQGKFGSFGGLVFPDELVKVD